MGSEICHTNNKEVDFSGNDSLKAIEEREKSLSFKIKEFIDREKPYCKELEDKKLTVKFIGKCLYCGETNTVNALLNIEFGQPHGIGKLYRVDGSLFVGKFRNGLADGMGYLIFSNGDLYEGFFVNDVPDDPKGIKFLIVGKLISRSSVYYGAYQKNKLHGEGEFISRTVHYKGEFKNGKISEGILKWKSSKGIFENEYKGNFDKNEKFTGNGLLKTEEGIYEGEFEDGLKNGKGKYVHRSGWRYEGFYLNGEKEGWGTLYDSKGKIKYEGRWRSNIPHGVGKEFDNKGLIIEDEFIEGLPSECLISV